VFINCLIENPSFDSQTKENMTLKEKAFGSKCTLSEKFIKSVCTVMCVCVHACLFICMCMTIYVRTLKAKNAKVGIFSQVLSSGVVESILQWAKIKSQVQLLQIVYVY